MSNPARAKGTSYETRLLGKLRAIWPELDRAKSGNKSNDFHGAPFPIEAKKRTTWSIPKWVRDIRSVSDGNEWAIFIEDGDLRSKLSAGEIMVVDADFGRSLLYFHKWLCDSNAEFDDWVNEPIRILGVNHS